MYNTPRRGKSFRKIFIAFGLSNDSATWFIPIIPALERQRQEDGQFEPAWDTWQGPVSNKQKEERNRRKEREGKGGREGEREK
jgi:hypothetical protein